MISFNFKLLCHIEGEALHPSLIPYRKVEVWVEKDSLRNFLEHVTAKYRMSIQVLRGFASLSMYRTALLRAAKRGVTKILYVGDFDPSGLLIKEVAEKEMAVQVEKIALTLEQIKRYNPPSIPVNRRDSRAKDYVKKYGGRCWEVEALKPGSLLKLVREKLRENVPQKYPVKAEAKERATRIAMPIVKRLAKGIEKEVLYLMKAGEAEEDIVRKLASKFHLHLKRNHPVSEDKLLAGP